ncbi:MAG: hypothetical protein ABIP81_06610 [Terriglobales bacterium]
MPFSMMQAEIQGAMLYTRGMVTINGNSARVSAPIKFGDALQTSADGTAQIVAEGTFIQVQPASSVLYNRSSVTLQNGTATIASAKGLTGQVNGLTVSAITPTGVRYALSNHTGRVQVAALMGNVMVRGSNALAVELKPGEVYTLDPTAESAASPQQDSGTGLLGDDAGLTFVITAAIIAGIIVGVVNATSISPAGPN